MSAGALLLVDLQNDFMPFGSLPVPKGDDVVEVANREMHRHDLVIATQDWHPADHGSFASNHPGSQPGDVVRLDGVEQVLWPDHCVQATPGASFHSSLDVTGVDVVVHKGTDARLDSYSTFFDNAHRRSTGLEQRLRADNVKRLVIMGLATDYCVLFSVLDARELDFEVDVLLEGCRAVDLAQGDGERAVERMRASGARIIG